MPGQAIFPIHIRAHGDASRQAIDTAGVGRLQKVAISIQRAYYFTGSFQRASGSVPRAVASGSVAKSRSLPLAVLIHQLREGGLPVSNINTKRGRLSRRRF